MLKTTNPITAIQVTGKYVILSFATNLHHVHHLQVNSLTLLNDSQEMEAKPLQVESMCVGAVLLGESSTPLSVFLALSSKLGGVELRAFSGEDEWKPLQVEVELPVELQKRKQQEM